MDIQGMVAIGDIMTAFDRTSIQINWPEGLNQDQVILVNDVSVDDDDAAEALPSHYFAPDEDHREQAPPGMLADLADALMRGQLQTAQALVDRIYDGAEQFELQRAIAAQIASHRIAA